MSLKDYEIREAREDEKPHLDWLLRDHFFQDEPTQRIFVEANAELSDPETLRLFRDCLQKRCMNFVAKNPCLVAVHRASNHVVGLLVVDLRDNPRFFREEIPPSNASLSDDPGKMWLSRFVGLFDKYDAFEVHPEVRNSLGIKFLVVIEGHKRRGLGEALMEAAVDLARARNIEMVDSLFTSSYSYRIAQKLGFVSYADDDVATVKDKHGNLALPGIDSHIMYAMTLKL